MSNVVVASSAPSATLEHDIRHVGQRQEQGFSLDEGNRQAHEQDADEIAGKLRASEPVERFEKTSVPLQKAQSCRPSRHS